MTRMFLEHTGIVNDVCVTKRPDICDLVYEKHSHSQWPVSPPTGLLRACHICTLNKGSSSANENGRKLGEAIPNNCYFREYQNTFI